ncbi:MAG TPA: DUF5666 domain-containing protein [Verrucomicrobiae bacterium]|nr:DUF5666 domain-containing protein [Verrucomicrobiae bacterium]
MKTVLRIAFMTLFIATLMAAPGALFGQETNAPAAAAKERGHALTGKLATVDATAGTITVGKHTFVVTEETKISREGQEAKLADFAIGSRVTVNFKKTDDGKFVALAIRNARSAGELSQ